MPCALCVVVGLSDKLGRVQRITWPPTYRMPAFQVDRNTRPLAFLIMSLYSDPTLGVARSLASRATAGASAPAAPGRHFQRADWKVP